MIRSINRLDVETLIDQARLSKRKRVIYRLHEHEEPVQRMVNAMIPGTYIPPHRHQDPDKVELFSILIGKVACLQFSERGEVTDIHLLKEHGPGLIADIAPRTYHTLIALQPSAVLEIIQGPYDVTTHKQFAPWAPEEDNAKAVDYLMYLESIVHNRM